MEATDRKTCPHCSKHFSSRAHMMRHANSAHSNQRLFKCRWCSKAFFRSDTMREHAARCDMREHLAVLPPDAVGRKRHACNSCKNRKVSCTGDTPCKRCVESGIPCTKETARVSKPKPHTSSNNEKLTHQERLSIDVLLNRFDSKSAFVSAFPNTEPSNQTAPPPPNQGMPVHPALTLTPDLASLPAQQDDFMTDWSNGHGIDLAFLTFDPFPSSGPLEFQAADLHGLTGPYEVSDLDLLESRILEIKSELHRYIDFLQIANGSPEKQALLKALAGFTPLSVQDNARLYFEHWHKHAPIVHKASLDIVRCATPLFMGIYCLGGLYSTPEEIEQVKLLFDVIENSCFDSAAIDWDPIPSDNPACFKGQVEVVQGLYTLVVAQYFSGTPLSRRRAANLRFGSATMLARRLGLTGACHKINMPISCYEQYRLWMIEETSIRTLQMLLLLDRGLSIFSNIPTRFELSELDIQLPCREAIFSAPSFEAAAPLLVDVKPKMRTIEAFRSLFLTQEGPKGAHITHQEGLTPWDMQILIHALYGFVWHHLFANSIFPITEASGASLISAINVALDNWKLWWEKLKKDLIETDWVMAGFHGYADFYWAMVKGLVHCSENTKSSKQKPIKAESHEVGAHLRSIFRQGGLLVGERNDPEREKYQARPFS